MSSFDAPDNRGNSYAHDMVCDSCFHLKTIGAVARRSSASLRDATPCSQLRFRAHVTLFMMPQVAQWIPTFPLLRTVQSMCVVSRRNARHRHRDCCRLLSFLRDRSPSLLCCTSLVGSFAISLQLTVTVNCDRNRDSLLGPRSMFDWC